MDAYAFEGCSSLQNVNLTLTRGSSIGDYAFRNCTSLETLVIPDITGSMGRELLMGCSSLRTLTIPFTGKTYSPPARGELYPFGWLFGETAYQGGVSTSQPYRNSSGDWGQKTFYIPSSLA